MKKIFCWVIGYVLFLSGCGYTTRAFISKNYRTIYIAPFENKIDIAKETESIQRYKLYQPLLERDIQETVINRINLDGNLKISDEDNADLILKGAVLDFRRDALRYLENDEVEEYRITITASIQLEDKNKNILIKSTDIIGDATYFLSGPNAKNEPLAIRDALDDLARRILERIIENYQ